MRVVIVTFKMPVVRLRKCSCGILPFTSSKIGLPLAKSSYNLSQCAPNSLETRAGPSYSVVGTCLYSVCQPVSDVLTLPLLFLVPLCLSCSSSSSSSSFLSPYPVCPSSTSQLGQMVGESLLRKETLKGSFRFRPVSESQQSISFALGPCFQPQRE